MRSLEDLYPIFETCNYHLGTVINYAKEVFELEESLLYLNWIKNSLITTLSINIYFQPHVGFNKEKFLIGIESAIRNNSELIEYKNKLGNLNNMTSQLQKVQWNKNDTDLYYLVDLLVENGYFKMADKSNFLEIVKELFIDRHGKQFKEKDIKQAIDNMENNKNSTPRNAVIVEGIVGKLKKD